MSAHWVAAAENRHKRPRDDEPLDIDDDYGYSSETVGMGNREPATPAKQMPKIKLSLKLGSRRKHKHAAPQQSLPLATTTANETIRYADGCSYSDRYSDDEPVDIGGTDDYNVSSGRQNHEVPVERRPSYASGTPQLLTQAQSPNRQAEGTSGSNTPRIRLKFSLNNASRPARSEEPARMAAGHHKQHKPLAPPKPPQLQIHNAWYDDYATSHQPSPLTTGFSSVAPGSPSESIASNASSAYNPPRFSGKVEMMHAGQTTYSPSRASDADSDDNRPDYHTSDADGNTYDERALLSAGTGHARRGGAAPRRRGRPPLRGRRSFGSARVGTRPPTTPRHLSGSLTTTVSLKSSLVRLITRIRKRDSYGFFMEPVNTSVITDYLGVIKQPMDLGTIQRKVESGAYAGIGEFRQDVMLVCENARKYNGVGSIYARSADHVQDYATAAIDRETAKLERVGKATIPMRSSSTRHDSDSLYGSPHSHAQSRVASRSHSPSGSVSPHHDSAADEHSDSRMGGEGRRSSRLRWRGTSESRQQQQQQQHQQQQPLVDATPASIVDNFKWSGTRKKSKRASAVPKRITESQVKVALLADGSIDPAGFEEDVAQVPFDNGHVSAPLVISTASSANATLAHGRYFAPAAFGDYGPAISLGRGAVGGSGTDELGGDMQTVHGDALGLAYWSSMSSFIDGAGSEVVQYASTVMDHLTSGGYAVASRTLEFLAARSAGAEERSTDAATDWRIGSIDLPEFTGWLDTKHRRDQIYTQRINALAKQLSLHDISAKCAAEQNSSARPERISETQKRQMFAYNNQKLKELYESQQQQGGSGGIDAGELESLEASIYTLSEQMCLALTKSKLPTAQIPALRRPPVQTQQERPLASPAMKRKPRPVTTASASARTLTSAGTGTGASIPPPLPRAVPGNSSLVPPRQNRTVSTPSLPMLHSASLASTVQSDLINDLAVRNNDSD
ncbi:hypothetical protein EV178_000171 [Coemansia sp. RSA 1646]|nr:hypothetical protein EV178_000171 [Coemansia sp. RSA 1646]